MNGSAAGALHSFDFMRIGHTATVSDPVAQRAHPPRNAAAQPFTMRNTRA